MKTRHKVGIIFLAGLIAISLAGMLVTRLKTGRSREAPVATRPAPHRNPGPGQDLMELRKSEIIRLVQHWEPALEEQILDPQFYREADRKSRMEASAELLHQAGSLRSMGALSSPAPLQGDFQLEMEHGLLSFSFTLHPEPPYRVLKLAMTYEAHQ
jgi:hypothetical protein